jgi:acetyl esterase
MPLEPRVRAIVSLANRLSGSGGEVYFPLERRADGRLGKLLVRVAIRPGRKVASISHRMIPVAEGSILVRIYRPHDGVLPLHVFMHGGGWCVGSLDDRDPRCQDIAMDAGCVVVSVDYRLAPENQYPTAPEDCYAAVSWLVAHAEEMGIDPAVVSVGGESAGGNLAAVVCLMARDRSGPSIVYQLLDVPATDLTMSQPSVDELATGYLLTRQSMEAYVTAYIRDPTRVTEPYASPLHAPDLSGLPPAWIMTAEFDPLRSDGEAYAARLREAGVDTHYTELKGHIHPSVGFTRLLASARAYHRASVTALRTAHREAQRSISR